MDTYSQWASGDTYQFMVFDGFDVSDACIGFYSVDEAIKCAEDNNELDVGSPTMKQYGEKNSPEWDFSFNIKTFLKENFPDKYDSLVEHQEIISLQKGIDKITTREVSPKDLPELTALRDKLNDLVAKGTAKTGHDSSLEAARNEDYGERENSHAKGHIGDIEH